MNFWNMQLHPDDSNNWSNQDIKKILDFGLIGCSGRPIIIFNKITKGDIIFVRHKDKEAIALVKALENPRDTLQNESNNYVWFDRCVSVKVLDFYENEKIPGEGFSFVPTIAQINDDRALTYVEGLYQNYLNKQKILRQEAKMQKHIEIILQKKQIILQGAPGTGKTRLAQMIAQELTKKGGETQLIQFHPAYSYEDFVRGIVAETNENGQINYKVQNKILAEMAKKAKENLDDSKKPQVEIKEKLEIEIIFDKFKEYIFQIIEKEETFKIEKSSVVIFGLDNEAFLFKGKTWKLRMRFKDVLHFFLQKFETASQAFEQVNGLSKHLAGYYLKMAKEFSIFYENEKLKQENIKNIQKIPLKNYVLIIDEINRANLPAVLGELIYALEYRNKPVNCLYELDGNREIILPENLYIIGTMNTADRSVGHIDYAIRRRFAFIAVPPDENVITNDNAKELFKKIKTIFKENLSVDFAHSVDDIMIGHSYFLVENDEELEIKLDYEIKPLLREYVKDGILTCDILEINKLKIT